MSKTLILTNQQVKKKLNRLVWQVYEHNYKEKEIIIAGIASRGVSLANMISKELEKISSIKVKSCSIKLNKSNPYSEDIKLDIEEKDYKNKVVIIVDDVLNSGKTLIYGVKYFLSVPLKSLYTLVLVDRNHNRFPIKADFVGLSLSTTLKEHVSVEIGRNIKVYLS